jgi:integrase
MLPGGSDVKAAAGLAPYCSEAICAPARYAACDWGTWTWRRDTSGLMGPRASRIASSVSARKRWTLLRAYLAVRGEVATDHAFTYRHRPLSPRYCASRLHTYGRSCGVRVTPHQLRHSCATLLLNCGAYILTVQAILGHRHVDTALGYARLYDVTVAAHYYARRKTNSVSTSHSSPV